MSQETLQTVIWKLKKLGCPVIANREDSWIKDLILANRSYRFQLLEWFLFKLNFGASEGPSAKLLDSPGEKSRYLLFAFSSLGFCKKDEQSLITGFAKETAQVNFWQKLTDVLWEKHEVFEDLHGKGDIALSDIISKEYLKYSTILNQIVSTVSSADLFAENVPLLPPDVSEYVDTMLSFPAAVEDMKRAKVLTLEELKLSARNEGNALLDTEVVSSTPISERCQTYSESANEETIAKANQLSSALDELHNNIQKFDEAYSHLKVVLKVPEKKDSDMGHAFERICGKMDIFQKVLFDVHVAEESSKYLEDLMVDNTLSKSSIKLSLQKSNLEGYVGTIKDSLGDLEKEYKEQDVQPT